MLVTTMAKRRTRFKLSPCPIPIFFFCFPLPYFFPPSSSYFFFLITNPSFFTSYQCWVVLGVCACLCALSIKVEMSWSACCVKVWRWGQLSILSLVDGELKKQGLIFGFFFFLFKAAIWVFASLICGRITLHIIIISAPMQHEPGVGCVCVWDVGFSVFELMRSWAGN